MYAHALSFENPSTGEIERLLRRIKKIAIVGISASDRRPSYIIARALQGFGYHITPVNPNLSEVLGKRVYSRLHDLPELTDLVNVFRAPKYVSDIVDECISLKIKALWLQDGVVDSVAALRAHNAGLTVVMDRCIYRDYVKLLC